MGFDGRVITEDRVPRIPDALRAAGFHVTVEVPVPFSNPEYYEKHGLVTWLHCHRDGEKITLYLFRHYRPDVEESDLAIDPNPSQQTELQIFIPNLSSWRSERNRRLVQLQVDVTSVLEECGAYSYAPSDHL